MPTLKQIFNTHAESIGLKVDKYFASFLNEERTQLAGSFYLDYPETPVVRFQYNIGSIKGKQGNLNMPLDSFLGLSIPDIDILKEEIELRSNKYDDLQIRLQNAMPNNKRELREWFSYVAISD